MIVRTSQDATAVNCGCCDMPSCDEPRKECESITVEACGYLLPTLSCIDKPNSCKLYKNILYEITDEIDQSLLEFTDGSVQESHLKNNSSINYTKLFSNSNCIENYECNSTQSEQVHRYFPSGGDVENYYQAIIARSATDEESSSHYIRTDSVNPESAYDYTNTDDNCSAYTLNLDCSWSIAGTSFINDESFDVDEITHHTLIYKITFSNPIVIDDLIAEIDARIALLGEEDSWGGVDCSSSVSVTVTHADPPDPEADPLPETEIVCTQPSAATKARYKIGIPNTDSYANYDAAHAAWVTAHAAWVSADPETRGPEPIEPTQRSVFECQWDEVFFPAEWEAWKLLYDAYVDAVNAYSAWVAAGSIGTPPVVPDDPGAEPSPAPSLVASRSWTYGGTDEFSEWFEIDIPEIAGETRVVNMMVKCFRSSRLGLKPTAHGEIYVL